MNIQDAYNEWSETYDSDENLTRDLDSLVTRAALTGQCFDSILEIGCGTGKNTMFLTEIGTRVHSLDFSQRMLAKAKAKVDAANLLFSHADLTKPWPCEDAAYDLIVCCLVLEHIEDLAHIFFEAARTLRPGGKFTIDELHPFKQYAGKKAQFLRDGEIIQVDAFVHHISDFLRAAEDQGLQLGMLNEHWHDQDQGKPPRLVSLMFTKQA